VRPRVHGSSQEPDDHDNFIAPLPAHLPVRRRCCVAEAVSTALRSRPKSARWRTSSIFKSLQPSARSLASIIFSTNIALSAVLAELILCEIANTVNPATRTLALKLTLPSLLLLLIVVTPAFEIHSVVSKTGLNANGGQKGQRRLAWVLEICGLAAWLGAFWYLGRGLLGSYLHEESYLHEHTFSEGCLERIGIIGISLMASLAGFAAISSLWQTFGVKYRPVRHAHQDCLRLSSTR
jgi:hypothetical protein